MIMEKTPPPQHHTDDTTQGALCSPGEQEPRSDVTQTSSTPNVSPASVRYDTLTPVSMSATLMPCNKHTQSACNDITSPTHTPDDTLCTRVKATPDPSSHDNRQYLQNATLQHGADEVLRSSPDARRTSHDVQQRSPATVTLQPDDKTSEPLVPFRLSDTGVQEERRLRTMTKDNEMILEKLETKDKEIELLNMR